MYHVECGSTPDHVRPQRNYEPASVDSQLSYIWAAGELSLDCLSPFLPSSSANITRRFAASASLCASYRVEHYPMQHSSARVPTPRMSSTRDNPGQFLLVILYFPLCPTLGSYRMDLIECRCGLTNCDWC